MSILNDIRAEIQRAEEKHGPLPISVPSTFTLREVCAELESTARAEIESFDRFSTLAIFAEEVGEVARAKTTPELRAELVQVVAVGLRWIAGLDGISAADCIPPQIVSTPDTLAGAPRIDGTRIPASLILSFLAGGMTETEIIADYPHLTPAEIRACLAYAATLADRAEHAATAATASNEQTIADLRPMTDEEGRAQVAAFNALVGCLPDAPGPPQRWRPHLIMAALGLPADDPPANAIEQIRRLREERADLLATSDAYQHMHTRAVRSEARLSAILAPVEGVDLEEVLRLCVARANLLAVPRHEWNTGQRCDSEDLAAALADAATALVHAAARARSMAHDYQALAADREGEIDRLKAALKFADEQGAEAIERVSRTIIADKWNSTAEAQAEVKRLTARLGDLEHEVAHLRDLCRRLLPSRYIAADGQVMDPERCTPHEPDCAECGRGRAHDEECLGVQPTPAEEVARLRARLAEVERERGETRAEAEELRLTLAAEQGRAEGAPSAGWRSAGGDWLKGRARVRRTNSSWWWFIYAPQPNDHKQTSAEGRESSARAAMLAADKAQEKS